MARSPSLRRLAPALVAVALLVSGCAGDPDPPPRAADWPAPLLREQPSTTPGATADAGEADAPPVSSPSSPPDDTVAPAPDPGPLPAWGALEARVATPEGELGPRTDTPVDPRLVDAVSWNGTRWEMERDWDETIDGGYLDFGAAALELNGHRVLGFHIEVPEGLDRGHLIDGGGEIGWFEITNPDRYAVNSYMRRVDLAHHYMAVGVAGDAIKVGEGSSVHHDAYIEMEVLPGSSDDKHYDAVQVFNDGVLELDRIVIQWNDSGTIAATTGAVFTQDDASLTVRDLIVLDPGGTWQIIRLGGDGPHDLDRVQVSGSRRPNVGRPDDLAPTALVRITNDTDRFTLYNEVPGAEDWLFPDS